MKEDKDIWEDFKNGEDYALSCIYHQNIDFLFNYGKKIIRDEDLILDIIQDLFYDLIKARKRLGKTDNIRLYLLKSFRRKLIREIEKNNKLTDLNKNPELQPQIVFSIEEDLIRTEEQTKKNSLILKGMQELSVKQREVLYYRFTCGFSYEQICEIMPVSNSLARQLVSRAITSLKKYVSDKGFICIIIFRR